MKSINIPTDNLYKFIAIFGLVILITSFYLENSLVEKMTEIVRNDLNRFDNHMKFINEINSNLASLQMSYHDLISQKNRIDSLSLTLQDDYLTNSKLMDKAIISLERDLMANNRLLGINENNLDIEKIKNETLFDLQNQIYDYNDSNFRRLSIMKIISVGMISLGFSLWYFKNQKYLDLEIKLRLLKLKEEISELN